MFASGGDRNDKSIILWDLVTLKQTATLKAHRGEIRALEFSRDGKFLFSGGQGGVYVWDLRNTSQPTEHLHKLQDVFSLQATMDKLFIGTRKHYVLPVSLAHGSPFGNHCQTHFEPPHFDVVTSFATLLDDKILISASKDKNLRGWSVHTDPNSKNHEIAELGVTQAHDD
jgi:WD40 repeat protein